MEGNLSPTIQGTFLWNLRIHSHPDPQPRDPLLSAQGSVKLSAENSDLHLPHLTTLCPDLRSHPDSVGELAQGKPHAGGECQPPFPLSAASSPQGLCSPLPSERERPQKHLSRVNGTQVQSQLHQPLSSGVLDRGPASVFISIKWG